MKKSVASQVFQMFTYVVKFSQLFAKQVHCFDKALEQWNSELHKTILYVDMIYQVTIIFENEKDNEQH